MTNQQIINITKEVKNSLNFNNIKFEYVHGLINGRALGRAVSNKKTGEPIKVQISIKHRSKKSLIDTICHELAHIELYQYTLSMEHNQEHYNLTQTFIKLLK